MCFYIDVCFATNTNFIPIKEASKIYNASFMPVKFVPVFNTETKSLKGFLFFKVIKEAYKN